MIPVNKELAADRKGKSLDRGSKSGSEIDEWCTVASVLGAFRECGMLHDLEAHARRLLTPKTGKLAFGIREKDGRHSWKWDVPRIHGARAPATTATAHKFARRRC